MLVIRCSFQTFLCNDVKLHRVSSRAIVDGMCTDSSPGQRTREEVQDERGNLSQSIPEDYARSGDARGRSFPVPGLVGCSSGNPNPNPEPVDRNSLVYPQRRLASAPVRALLCLPSSSFLRSQTLTCPCYYDSPTTIACKGNFHK